MFLSRIVDRYRYGVIVLRQMVAADFKLRYQGSVLGYLWSLLRPLALFTVLYIVFVRLLKIGGDTPNFGLALLLGIVIWNFFVEVTNQSLGSIVGKGDLLRKVKFPRYVVPLAPAVSALINLFLNLLVVAVFMIITGVKLQTVMVWAPLLLIELFILSVAVAFILSALYVRFRDLTHIWDITLQALFYATPILYPLSLIPSRIAKWLMLNPLAQVIQDLRYLVIDTRIPTIDDLYASPLIRLIPFGISFTIMVLAIGYFKRRSAYFAEEV